LACYMEVREIEQARAVKGPHTYEPMIDGLPNNTVCEGMKALTLRSHHII
jgi:hypothetical protein